MLRRTRFVVSALAILGAGALGLLLQQRWFAAPLEPMTRRPTPAAPAVLAPAEATALLPSIPDRLPSFTLSGLDGKPVASSVWEHRSLIVNFWATWCAPCRREMPLLETLHQELGARDFEIVGIAVDQLDAVKAYAARMHIDYPILIGEQDALDLISALGVAEPVFPFSVFTDRQGRIVAVKLGELKRPMADAILARIDEINQNRANIDEIRREIAADSAKQR
jgi:thiol-disulfide isomerase/thioredoxin